MDKINGAGHVARQFVTEDAGQNRPPTEITAEWLNGIQNELVAVIEGAGLVLSSLDNTQLRQAIAKMIQAGQRAVIVDAAIFAGAVAGTGKAVYWDSANNRFDLAAADGSVKQSAVGFADVPNAKVYCFGSAALFAGLTPGARYYLDAAGGGITSAMPAANAVFVGIAKSATELFVDIDVQPTMTQATMQGAFKNLALSANGMGNTVSVSFDEVILGDGAGGRLRVGPLAYTLPANGAGAWNGGTQVLDTGAWAANTWYYVWIIGAPGGGTASLVSLSPTAPTMPAGITYKALLGVFRTDGTANKYPLSFKQMGRSWQYIVASGTNLTAIPVMASGTAGSTATPTWVPVGVINYVPSLASRIIGIVSASSTNGTAMAAPNNAYGAMSSLINPAPAGANAVGTGGQSSAFNFVLESNNIYWAATTTNGALACFGFELNL